MDVVVTPRADPRPLKYWGSKFRSGLPPAPRVNRCQNFPAACQPLLMRSPLGARASANTLARCARRAALGRLGPSAIYAHARPARRRESVTHTRHPCALVPLQALSHSLARACDLCWAFERSRLSLRWAEQIQCAVPSESSERITTHGMRLLVTRVLHDPPACMSHRCHALRLLTDCLLTICVPLLTMTPPNAPEMAIEKSVN